MRFAGIANWLSAQVAARAARRLVRSPWMRSMALRDDGSTASVGRGIPAGQRQPGQATDGTEACSLGFPPRAAPRPFPCCGHRARAAQAGCRRRAMPLGAWRRGVGPGAPFVLGFCLAWGLANRERFHQLLSTPTGLLEALPLCGAASRIGPDPLRRWEGSCAAPPWPSRSSALMPFRTPATAAGSGAAPPGFCSRSVRLAAPNRFPGSGSWWIRSSLSASVLPRRCR